MSKSRESWTIEDYKEELHHLNELDEMPWIDKRIIELKEEMRSKFTTSELIRNGFDTEEFRR
jgi:hypothetical protein